MFKFNKIITVIGLSIGTLFAEQQLTKQETFDQQFKARFNEETKAEITSVKVPIELEVSEVVVDGCSFAQRVIRGIDFCTTSFQGKITKISPEDNWLTTVSAKEGVSNYGRAFLYERIKHMISLSESNKEMYTKKLSTDPKHYLYSVGVEDESLTKLFLKAQKKGETVKTHAIISINVKKSYAKYDRKYGYESLDVEWGKSPSNVAGTPNPALTSSKNKFDQLYDH
ncbi:MAG: hypothetical protein KC646_18180 [Candidatus Cloacimonetes bacterium]|nr:hypothetical protein [Candidatus Cloacimonadota bacterium]